MIETLVFVDDNCPSCEKVVGVMRSLGQEVASVNIRVVHRRKEPTLAALYNVQIVPAVFVNGKLCFYGDFTREEFQRVRNLDEGFLFQSLFSDKGNLPLNNQRKVSLI